MDSPDPTTDEPLPNPSGCGPATDPEVEVDDDEDGEVEPIGLVTLAEVLPMSQYVIPVGEWDRPPSERVQYALDMLIIAAAERAARILRSDLPA
jgi:hypothetical protein